MGYSNAPGTQASTRSPRTTTYSDDNYEDDGKNVKDYDMPDTYRHNWSYCTSQPPGYDQVNGPESLWPLY